VNSLHETDKVSHLCGIPVYGSSQLLIHENNPVILEGHPREQVLTKPGGGFMRRLFLLLSLIALLAFAAGSAQAQDKIELFGGYSYVHAPTSWAETLVCPFVTCPVTVVNPKLNLNGWEISGVFKAKEWLGLAADFSGHYGSFNGASYHSQTYLFGPQVSFPGRVSPFAHVFVGGAHATSGTGAIPLSAVTPANGSTNNGFATAVGAGIDIKIAPLIWFRPIQIDYLATRFNANTQSQPRISAGVVLHF
jgi:hypothetical protein